MAKALIFLPGPDGELLPTPVSIDEANIEFDTGDEGILGADLIRQAPIGTVLHITLKFDDNRQN